MGTQETRATKAQALTNTPNASHSNPDDSRARSAFVIMPFDVLSDQVFEVLIRPALERSGYEVHRADTTDNLRLIMRDIVEGIQSADLVVADLSGRNANVFWELGLAHGLRKQVILLARAASDIPFDLGGYRAVIYRLRLKTPMDLDETLSTELSSRLEAVREGGIRFGDPLSDFGYPLEGQDEDEGPEPLGLLDDLAGLEFDASQVGAYIAELPRLLKALGDDMKAATAKLGPAEPGSELRQTRSLYQAYAPIWDQHAETFEDFVAATLLPMTVRAQRGFAALLKIDSINGVTDDSRRRELIASLESIAEPASEYVQMFLEAAGTTRQYSQLTSSLRRPGDRLAVVLERIAGLFEQLSRLSADLEDGMIDTADK